MTLGFEKFVMIVDDEYGIRDSLSQILEDEGYQVESAINGQEALVHLRQNFQTNHLPCVILLDLMMPIMDGWQFRAAQQNDPSLAIIPVIVISASSNLKQKAASINVTEYLPKPIELEKLLATVARFCPT